MYDSDTIAAIATAAGEAGIGIIRISGPDSLNILKKVFRYPSGAVLAELTPRRMIYGSIVDNETVLDEAMVVYMKAPHTYTGEDVAEIQCHGSSVALRRILSLVLRSGAVPAGRGEFTKRAFMNGRMDLSQAEAVIDIIQARSTAGSAAAVSQLTGRLSRRIHDIRTDMAQLMAEIAARIEYPEEDLEEMTYAEIRAGVQDLLSRLTVLADSANTGKMLRDGVNIAIVGRPNVGKSSLMNALLQEDRAIVTSIPGTTRDTIEEYADLGGIPVRITDTAGIREADDAIEKIGIERSRSAVERADLIIVMTDGSEPLREEDKSVFPMVQDKRCILVINKSDLPSASDEETIRRETGLPDDIPSVVLSAASGEGLDALSEMIQHLVYGGEITMEQDVMITDARHESLLRSAISDLADADHILQTGEALDFAESDIRSAWMTCGEITGESASDDIVEEIFSRFCLGK